MMGAMSVSDCGLHLGWMDELMAIYIILAARHIFSSTPHHNSINIKPHRVLYHLQDLLSSSDLTLRYLASTIPSSNNHPHTNTHNSHVFSTSQSNISNLAATGCHIRCRVRGDPH